VDPNAFISITTGKCTDTADYVAVAGWRNCELAASHLGFAVTSTTNVSLAYQPYFGCCYLYSDGAAEAAVLYSNPSHASGACSSVAATTDFHVACAKVYTTPSPTPQRPRCVERNI
jgi:hypothetical protein